jgi:hypothetical protein
MKRSLSLTAIATFGIAILLLVITSNGISKPAPIQVIRVSDAVNFTEQQKIDVFINELLNAKSAKCLRNILMVESHMNPKAKNPTSSAVGVGQLLASTYKNIGLQHSADPLAQVIATIAYISRHYGNTCDAWAFEHKNNWY